MKRLPPYYCMLALAPSFALACGACDEDKMAATYDHAVVQGAAAQQRQMVFCDVRGRVPPERLRQAAAQVEGIDPASVRTSVEPSALSFALDTKVQSVDSAVVQIRARLDVPATIVVLKGLATAEGTN